MDTQETAIRLREALRDTNHKVRQLHMSADTQHSFGDFRILNIIHHCYQRNKQGIKASTIAEILNVAPPTVSQKISDFEAQGYILRKQSEKDRRVAFLYLTEKGEKAIESNIDNLNINCTKAVKNMGQEKAEMLISLLEEFKNNLSDTYEKE